MYLWQDYGIFGVFDPETGWCRPDAAGDEPGGVKGVVCDVIPDGDDMIAWLGVGLHRRAARRLLPLVLAGRAALGERGARATRAGTVRVQHVAAQVDRARRVRAAHVVAFTGIAFAFPNMKGWYAERHARAARRSSLWSRAETRPPSRRRRRGATRSVSTSSPTILEREFPGRAVEYVCQPAGDKRGVYVAWMTRGFSPWTREGGAGNVWVTVDQYTGEILADGTPEDGNVFDQAWDDWSYPLHTGDFGGPVDPDALGPDGPLARWCSGSPGSRCT